jgi:hypothetical protein
MGQKLGKKVWEKCEKKKRGNNVKNVEKIGVEKKVDMTWRGEKRGKV